MARTWLSIRVDLIEGHGRRLWPRPGRIFAAARTHAFGQLGDAIDTAFSRWDRSHLTTFDLGDHGGRLYGPIRWDDMPQTEIPGRFVGDVRLSTLTANQQFVYTFDMGDDWTHLCTVGPQRVDPLDQLGIVPNMPLPYWGWGTIPDQYGRRFIEDQDDETPLPPDPDAQDLPPIHPYWGPRPTD